MIQQFVCYFLHHLIKNGLVLGVVYLGVELLLLDAEQTRSMTSQHDVTSAEPPTRGARAEPPHADKCGGLPRTRARAYYAVPAYT